ncbi:MAG: hypothetical protein AMJ79_12020 [Phycisphaerae bacterium SM23_30]|nr:MAG: hypothetical protein AMJ79_12020 [Phycisphaerae bacterium SM23_30]
MGPQSRMIIYLLGGFYRIMVKMVLLPFADKRLLRRNQDYVILDISTEEFFNDLQALAYESITYFGTIT